MPAADPSPAEALSLPASRVPDPMTAPALRWGIISPGGIAGSFARALHRGTTSQVTAVCSRALERAEAFAADHVPAEGTAARAFGEVSAMLEAGDIDAVYIASPHAQHHDYAREVLEAGLPVLVEKAFTLNRPQAEELFALARQQGVLAMEAMWMRFLPQLDVLGQVVAAGLLGDVVTVAADHGQFFATDPAHRLFAPELGGGALLDLGVYPISFAQAVLGDLAELAVRGSLTPTGVDAQASILARGARGGMAVLDTTLLARTPTEAWVAGSAGRARLTAPFYAPGTLTVELDDGRRGTFTHPKDPSLGMAYEAAEFARCLRAGRLESAAMTWADTLSVLGTMDGVRQQLGTVYPGESAPGQVRTR